MILVSYVSALHCPLPSFWFGEGDWKASRLWVIACKLDVGFFIWISNEPLHCHFGSYMQKKPSFVLRCLSGPHFVWFLAGFLFCLASYSDSDDKSIYIVPGWSCFSYFLCETLVPDNLFFFSPPSLRHSLVFSWKSHTYPQSLSQSRRWSNLLWLQ